MAMFDVNILSSSHKISTLSCFTDLSFGVSILWSSSSVTKPYQLREESPRLCCLQDWERFGEHWKRLGGIGLVGSENEGLILCLYYWETHTHHISTKGQGWGEGLARIADPLLTKVLILLVVLHHHQLFLLLHQVVLVVLRLLDHDLPLLWTGGGRARLGPTLLPPALRRPLSLTLKWSFLGCVRRQGGGGHGQALDLETTRRFNQRP